MTPELAALLTECRLHLRATEALFATLPDRLKTNHLAARAHLLAERCVAAVRDGRGPGQGAAAEGDETAEGSVE